MAVATVVLPLAAYTWATAAAEAFVVLQSTAAAADKRLRQVLGCVDLAPDVGCERLLCCLRSIVEWT